MIESMQIINNTDNDNITYPPTIGRLTDIRGVKRELGRLYKDARTGNTPTYEASKLAYILNILANIMINSDLEERLTEIEKKIEKRRKR